MSDILAGVFGSPSPLRASLRLQASAVARRAAARHGALIIAVLGLLAFGVTLYVCLPGYMGPDSRTQLEQARAFEFWDDHPVLMALIWHYLDRLVPGPAGMFVFINIVYWAGLSGLFWGLRGPIGWRALGLVAVGFFPPAFLMLPVVYKDGLMHGALLMAIACVVPLTRRALAIRLAVAVVCFSMAIGVRHNAAAAVWPFLALPLMRLQVVARWGPWLRLAVASAAGLVLAFLMTLGMDRAVAPLSHRTEFWQMIPAYDLAGMSLRAGEVLVERDSAVLTHGMGLKEIRRLFHADYGNSLYYCIPFAGKRCVPVFRYTLNQRELARLSRNWLSAIAEHPRAYLAHRWALTRAIMTVNTRGEVYWLSGAPHGPLAKLYPPSQRLLWLLGFMQQHIRSVAYSPWVYVIASLLLLPFTLRLYQRRAAPLPLLFVLSGTAYMLSNLVGAIASEYRYASWTILCAVLAIITSVVPEGWAALRFRPVVRS